MEEIQDVIHVKQSKIRKQDSNIQTIKKGLLLEVEEIIKVIGIYTVADEL